MKVLLNNTIFFAINALLSGIPFLSGITNPATLFVDELYSILDEMRVASSDTHTTFGGFGSSKNIPSSVLIFLTLLYLQIDDKEGRTFF